MKLFLIGSFACLGIFLFVSAPPELPLANSRSTDQSESEVMRLFSTANAISDAARQVYTKNIVGGGQAAGLKFGEDWDEPGIDKGPLPALFLRLVARQLERRPEPLGLYLGSDEPINKSNLFSKDQMSQFKLMKKTMEPQLSVVGTSLSVAMFPDIASAKPCVDCHNDHADSPKTDWKLNDVMGATTWSYPAPTVSETELLFTSKALYESIAAAYEIYLEKARTFENPILIGTDWPIAHQRALPNVDRFMAAVLEQAGFAVTQQLFVQ